MRRAPSVITQLTSSLHQDGKGPPAPPAFKSRVEALALAAVRNTFDTVIDQWLRGGIPIHDAEHPSEVSSAATKEAVPAADPHFVNPWETITSEAKPKQSEHIPGENAAFDHLAPLVTEGTKTLTGIEEPSGLDWLSMVANMDTSWDDYVIAV